MMESAANCNAARLTTVARIWILEQSIGQSEDITTAQQAVSRTLLLQHHHHHHLHRRNLSPLTTLSEIEFAK